MTASIVFLSALGCAGDLGAFLPGLFELGPNLLKLLTAQAGPHLREPIPLFFLDVMRDRLHQHRGLGVEPFRIGRHGGQFHAQDVGDVMLFIGLEHVLLEIGQQRPDPRYITSFSM